MEKSPEFIKKISDEYSSLVRFGPIYDKDNVPRAEYRDLRRSRLPPRGYVRLWGEAIGSPEDQKAWFVTGNLSVGKSTTINGLVQKYSDLIRLAPSEKILFDYQNGTIIPAFDDSEPYELGMLVYLTRHGKGEPYWKIEQTMRFLINEMEIPVRVFDIVNIKGVKYETIGNHKFPESILDRHNPLTNQEFCDSLQEFYDFLMEHKKQSSNKENK